MSARGLKQRERQELWTLNRELAKKEREQNKGQNHSRLYQGSRSERTHGSVHKYSDRGMTNPPGADLNATAANKEGMNEPSNEHN